MQHTVVMFIFSVFDQKYYNYKNLASILNKYAKLNGNVYFFGF